MNDRATIGLCVKNAANSINYAFDTIKNQDYPHSLLTLIIVDNGSSDNTLPMAKEFARQIDIRTIVLCNRSKGLAASRQMVVENAEGDYIIWVDDDYILKKNFVREQVEFMQKNPEIGAARGLHIQNPKTTLVGSLVIAGFVLPSWNSPRPEHIGTGGAIFRRIAIEKVHGFDSKIKGAGEDVDLSERIRRSGWPLATNPAVGVLKKRQGEATLRNLWKQQIWYGYGNHYIFHKFKNSRLIFDYNLPYAFLYGVVTSKKIYKVTNKKGVFFFTGVTLFIRVAQLVGFVRAHFEGYGHHFD